ncbi:probable ATP-dependent RNA helicase ddx56 [Liolophura sinensis]|uniref:probable ATP-dependent RNA helicase ddx56 n=1 Tax=Liolophura sinensis TaxID=3198878 RepID=UPI00315825B0
MSYSARVKGNLPTMRQYNKEDAVKQDDVDVDVSDDDDPFNPPAMELVQDSEENEDEIDGNGDDSEDDDVSDNSESDKEMDVRENTKNTEEVDVGDNETSSAIPRVNVVVADVQSPDVRSPVPVEEKGAKLDNGKPFIAAIRNNDEINGIRLPGTNKGTRVSAFADDTTAILSEESSVPHVIKIAESYGKASGAKLNLLKSTVLPIGNWDETNVHSVYSVAT